MGLELMNALTPDQQKSAIIGTKIPRDVITTAQVDNIDLKYAGIGYNALAARQRELDEKAHRSICGPYPARACRSANGGGPQAFVADVFRLDRRLG